MFSKAQNGHPVLASCAITFYRMRAMMDAHHPEFLGEWLGAPTPEPRSPDQARAERTERAEGRGHNGA